MSNFSPQVFLLWVILTVTLAIFYIHHLWHFDRFHCLNMFRKHQTGTFTRFMTFSYLTTLPLLFTYTMGLAVIKYKEGYVTLPSGLVVPKPYGLWNPDHQAANFPLNIIFALAWGTEAYGRDASGGYTCFSTTMIPPHIFLEELCFWFFLIRSGPSPIPWFKSIYFKIWACGSITAMALVPVATTVTRGDPIKNDAWLQFVGSTIDLIITLGFLPILWLFPGFVQKVKTEGGDKEAIMRLVKFHDLNITRTAFRFLFVVPFTMLSIDGLRSHVHYFNGSLVWTDVLAMSSGVGCIVQSALTLLIFFPRDVELETRRWLREPTAKPRIFSPQMFKKSSKASTDRFQLDHGHPPYILTDSPAPGNPPLPHTSSLANHFTTNISLAYEDQAGRSTPSLDEAFSMTSPHHQRRWNNTSAVGLMEAGQSDMTPTLNPMVHSFRSPISIDLPDFPQRL